MQRSKISNIKFSGHSFFNLVMINFFLLSEVLHIRLPDENLSIADHAEECSFERLNDLQVHAVKKALRNPFTLIQGPPGKSFR